MLLVPRHDPLSAPLFGERGGLPAGAAMLVEETDLGRFGKFTLGEGEDLTTGRSYGGSPWRSSPPASSAFVSNALRNALHFSSQDSERL